MKCCLINYTIVCGAEVCEGFCVECGNLGSEEERTRSREDCDLLILTSRRPEFLRYRVGLVHFGFTK